MPKDLTKLSLKDFEAVSSGDFDHRMRWSNGTLEMTVTPVGAGMDSDDEYDD